MLELKMDFLIENPDLPLELDRALLSFIKKALSNYSEELYNQLYDKNRSILKSYCFAYYLPGARFLKNHIHLRKNSFSITFSDPDLEELLTFFNAFSLMLFQKYSIYRNSMELIAVKFQNLPEIKNPEIIIRMQSSLLARKHDLNNKDTYYTCEDSEFSSVIKENLNFFLKKNQISFSTDSFSITPVNAKKIVTRVWGRTRDASIGDFKLSGDPQLLTFLQSAGIGSRRSEGHGKWRLC